MIAVGSASAATCSNATLKGVLGTLDLGFKAGQFETTLTQSTADGNGHLSGGTATNSTSGTITTTTFTGTYSIAKNCTGSYTVTFPNNSTASGNTVSDNMNKGAQTIRTDSGFVKSGVILAQGVVACGLTGKKQTFAANLNGTINGVGAVSLVGQVILDGKGKVSGTETASLNGTIATASITGTYTENANCTGTAQITPQGFSTTNFNFVVVNAGKEILLIETDSGTTISGTMQQ
ncbi:MAG: hypothetical protein ACHP7J_02670 [Terriglobales bacterium]